MFRKLAGGALVGLLLFATAVIADEVKGKVTKVDDANHKITISVDGKETEYTVAKDCKFPKRKSKDGTEKEINLKSIAKQLDAKDKFGDVKLTAVTEKKDGKVVITEIKLDGARGKKDKEKDK